MGVGVKGRGEGRRVRACRRVSSSRPISTSRAAELAFAPSYCQLHGGRHRYEPLQQEGGYPSLSQVISRPWWSSLSRAGMLCPHSHVLGLGFPLPMEREAWPRGSPD